MSKKIIKIDELIHRQIQIIVSATKQTKKDIRG